MDVWGSGIDCEYHEIIKKKTFPTTKGLAHPLTMVISLLIQISAHHDMEPNLTITNRASNGLNDLNHPHQL